jgi:glycerate kinase
MPIPERLLIASGPFGARLPAKEVAAAIAGGVREAGRPDPELWPIEPAALQRGDADANVQQPQQQRIRAWLEAEGFDAHMRASRAVVIAWERLEERTLAGSATFEIATRARQAGVPAYSITAHNELNAFDTRILDLQLILRAAGVKTLAAEGRRLAELA